ncbi:MAG: patatin-like phospholipase family protein [Magnetococcales bacterium]|nr:patatin-like phospholipase family protein [Magnetococcales bacterium]
MGNQIEPAKSAEEVLAVESEKLKLKNDGPACGLGLSGGGIRSAAFNLGLLQALGVTGLMEKFHYLSTVSGGGYIGSAYSWFKACDNNESFPFDVNDPIKRRRVDWIRSRGNYLTPTEGLNIWAILAAILRGTVINMAVVIPIFWLFLLALAIPNGIVFHQDLFDDSNLRNMILTMISMVAVYYILSKHPKFRWVGSLNILAGSVFMAISIALVLANSDYEYAGWLAAMKPDSCMKMIEIDWTKAGYPILSLSILYSGLSLAAVLAGILFIGYAVFSKCNGFSAHLRTKIHKGSGRLLWFSLGLVTIGGIPYFHEVLTTWWSEAPAALSATTLLGAMTTLAG